VLKSNVCFSLKSEISDFITFKDPLSHFSIQYPQNWTLIYNNSSKDIVTFKQLGNNFSSEIYITQTESKKIPLKNLIENQIASNFKMLNDFKLIQFNQIHNESKLQFFKMIYTYNPFYEPYTNKIEEIWIGSKLHTFTITFKANTQNYDKNHPTFEHIVNSFTLTD